MRTLLLLTLGILLPTGGPCTAQFPELKVRQGTNCQLRVDENDRVVVATFRAGAGKLRTTGLNRFRHLEMVDVDYYTDLNKDDIDYLSTLRQITELKLGQAAGGAECVTIDGDLTKLSQLTRLEWLELCKKGMKDEDLAFIAKLPRIKGVVIEATKELTEGKRPAITDKCAEYLRVAKTLESIDIVGGAALTDRFVSRIASLPRLEMLRFNHDVDKLTDKSLGLLALRTKKLTWLDVRSKQFTDKGVRLLSNMTKLEILWLASPKLTSECVSSIKSLKRLRHLELTPASVDDAGFKVIAELPKLEILAFRKPALTDEQFAMFANHPSLQSAFLNGSKLSPENAMDVIHSLPKLQHISFGGNEQLQKLAEKELTHRKKLLRPTH
ncbi:MAG: hypothetical protein AB8G99_01045 [Planctomycetaceae bacterium]